MTEKVYGGVTVRYLPRPVDDPEEEKPMYTLTERTYVNGDRSRVVAESDPEAAFLLGNAGMKISDAEARRLGLIEGDEADDEDEEKPGAERKNVPGAPEDKAVNAPESTKRGG